MKQMLRKLFSILINSFNDLIEKKLILIKSLIFSEFQQKYIYSEFE